MYSYLEVPLKTKMRIKNKHDNVNQHVWHKLCHVALFKYLQKQSYAEDTAIPFLLVNVQLQV